MALKHSVYDTDAHFKIDHVTRTIKNESSGKNVLIQNDHNCERLTFELPRMIDGHDMSKCDEIQVHYINIDSKDKTKISKDIHEVDDLQISPDGDDVVICSWLIDGKATRYAGSLNFLLKFKCIADDGSVSYVWNTAIFTGISVSSGMDNGEAIVEEYSDILEQWRQELVEAITSVSVEQTDTGAVITITDKNDTTTATITNGKDGSNGKDAVGSIFHTTEDPAYGVDWVVGKLYIFFNLNFTGERNLQPGDFIIDRNGRMYRADTVVTTRCTAKAIMDLNGNADFQTDETLKLENGVLSVNTTNDMEQDNTLPITSAGVFATVGNIEALLKTI